MFGGASEALAARGPAATQPQPPQPERDRQARSPGGAEHRGHRRRRRRPPRVAVVEARRLCDAAQPGEILCSELVHVRRRFTRVAPVRSRAVSRDLKGLAGPLATCTLLWGDEAPRPPDDAPRLHGVRSVDHAAERRRPAIGGPKERAVLGTLLAADGAAVSVDALIDAVWRGTRRAVRPRTVHSYIARLRRALGPCPSGDGWLIAQGRAYVLPVDRAHLDAFRFADTAATGRTLLERGDPGAAITAFNGTRCRRGAALPTRVSKRSSTSEHGGPRTRGAAPQRDRRPASTRCSHWGRPASSYPISSRPSRRSLSASGDGAS